MLSDEQKIERLMQIQRAGWRVEVPLQDSVVVRCPAYGCGLRATIKDDDPVQGCDPNVQRSSHDIPIANFEQTRSLLKQEREKSLMTLSEVEAAAGLTSGHLNKAEKENPQRQPTLDTLVLWAGALGYELVLRPKPLTKLSCRIRVETIQNRPRRLGRRDRQREERAAREGS